MSLELNIAEEIKVAMKARDNVSLEALRAIKSAIILAKTETGAKESLAQEDEIKLLQKLVKQRKDSAEIYLKQGRNDLAQPELEQVAVIEKFLPKQLSAEEVKEAVKNIILNGNFSGMASMGQVMGVASKELAGKTDGKTISAIVKELLA